MYFRSEVSGALLQLVSQGSGSLGGEDTEEGG